MSQARDMASRTASHVDIRSNTQVKMERFQWGICLCRRPEMGDAPYVPASLSNVISQDGVWTLLYILGCLACHFTHRNNGCFLGLSRMQEMTCEMTCDTFYLRHVVKNLLGLLQLKDLWQLKEVIRSQISWEKSLKKKCYLEMLGTLI